MNIEQANTISIFDYLDKINVKPHRHTGHRAVYLSPIREEKTPSFSVNIKKNCWFDHGLKIGGDLVGLVQKRLEFQGEDSTVHDALRVIENIAGYLPRVTTVKTVANDPDEPALSITSIAPISHSTLVKLLASRGISLDVAKQHLQQAKVYNKNSQRHLFALVLENESEGYQLRNPHIKCCVGKKDVTVIRGEDENRIAVHVFEGDTDFLSVLEYRKVKQLKDDTIILNSVTQLEKAIALIKNYTYRTVYSWMDNDLAGMRATIALDDFIKTQKELRHKPMNGIYAYKDVNHWHMRSRGLKAI